MRRPVRLTALLLLATLPLSACGSDDDEPAAAASKTASPTAAPAPPELSIKAVEYGFQVSGPLTAGMTKISFTNAGKEVHMTGLGKMKEGKTLADVQAALKSGEEAAFNAVFDEKEGDANAPQALSPGLSATTYTNLSAGKYSLICFIPAPDGKSHYEKGMLSELTVAAAASAEAIAAPNASVELTFANGKLTGPASVPAGKTVFKVTSDANHELIGLIPLNGATPEQALAYIEAKFESDKPPTGPELGAIGLQLHDFDAGEEIYFELDLQPGKLMLGCELEDGGKPKHSERLIISVT